MFASKYFLPSSISFMFDEIITDHTIIMLITCYQDNHQAHYTLNKKDDHNCQHPLCLDDTDLVLLVTLKLGNHRKLLVTCSSLSRAALPPFKYVLTRGVSQFVLTFNFYFQAANMFKYQSNE